MIAKEDFEDWKLNPTTIAVLAELARMADERKQLWLTKSWNEGVADERALAMLRGQAEGFGFAAKASYEQLFGEPKK